MSFESGLRAALKDAITARDLAADQVEGARSAVLRIEDQLFEARRKLQAAQSAAGEEQERLVQEIVAGGSATLLQRVNGAREADIEAEIVSCKTARDLCKVALANAERSLDFKQRLLGDAVNAVLATAAPRLIAATAAAKKEFDALATVCRFLRSSLSSDECRRKLDEAIAYPLDFDLRDHPALAPWKAAAEALARDSDAELPGKDGSL